MNKQSDYHPPIFPWDVQAERRAWSRVLASLALAEIHKGNPRQILRASWPDDARAALILRSATSPTDTVALPGQATVVTWRSLSPSSAAWRLFSHESALRLDLTGIATIGMPNVASLPPAPVFVAEGVAAGVVQWQWSRTTLGPAKKILVLSAVTNELMNATPENAASIIGRVLSDATAKSIDTICFDTAPADAIRPAGLCHSVAPITASAATDHGAALIEDLANLAGQIAGNGVDASSVVYICGAREAQTIKMRAGPQFDSLVLSSLGVLSKTIICVAPAGISSGYQGPPSIETGSTTLVFQDTAPVGDPPTAPTKNLWQTDGTSIRVRAQAAWCAAPGSVAITAGIAW
jgi:hypothetical protein